MVRGEPLCYEVGEINPFRVGALETLRMVITVCSWILVRGARRAPDIIVTKSVRFNELVIIYFTGYTALPTGLCSHVTM